MSSSSSPERPWKIYPVPKVHPGFLMEKYPYAFQVELFRHVKNPPAKDQQIVDLRMFCGPYYKRPGSDKYYWHHDVSYAVHYYTEEQAHAVGDSCAHYRLCLGHSRQAPVFVKFPSELTPQELSQSGGNFTFTCMISKGRFQLIVSPSNPAGCSLYDWFKNPLNPAWKRTEIYVVDAGSYNPSLAPVFRRLKGEYVSMCWPRGADSVYAARLVTDPVRVYMLVGSTTVAKPYNPVTLCVGDHKFDIPVKVGFNELPNLKRIQFDGNYIQFSHDPSVQPEDSSSDDEFGLKYLPDLGDRGNSTIERFYNRYDYSAVMGDTAPQEGPAGAEAGPAGAEAGPAGAEAGPAPARLGGATSKRARETQADPQAPLAPARLGGATSKRAKDPQADAWMGPAGGATSKRAKDPEVSKRASSSIALSSQPAFGPARPTDGSGKQETFVVSSSFQHELREAEAKDPVRIALFEILDSNDLEVVTRRTIRSLLQAKMMMSAEEVEDMKGMINGWIEEYLALNPWTRE